MQNKIFSYCSHLHVQNTHFYNDYKIFMIRVVTPDVSPAATLKSPGRVRSHLCQTMLQSPSMSSSRVLNKKSILDSKASPANIKRNNHEKVETSVLKTKPDRPVWPDIPGTRLKSGPIQHVIPHMQLCPVFPGFYQNHGIL